MNLRLAALFCAVVLFASGAFAQDSRNKQLVEQQLRLEMLQKQGRINEAQKQALQLKLLQQMRGQSTGPKTGVYPGGPMQGGMTGGPVQPPRNIQAEKSREQLKKKADAKKGKKDKAQGKNKDKEDKEGDKEEKKDEPNLKK